jgi:RNA polymerase sigma-70 factor (ECF subfamily)
MSDDTVDRLPGFLVSANDELAQEFDRRLADSSALAFRVAFSVLRHREDAEDVAQEAFVRAHRSIRQLRDRDRFRAWLVRMTWRLAMDRRRGDLRRQARELEVPALVPPPTTEDQLVARQQSERLWRAIDGLPEKLRIVIVLAAIEEQRVEQVARLLKIPAGTVKSRLFEARKRLQGQF